MTCQKVLERRFIPTTSEAMGTLSMACCNAFNVDILLAQYKMLPIVTVRGLLDD